MLRALDALAYCSLSLSLSLSSSLPFPVCHSNLTFSSLGNLLVAFATFALQLTLWTWYPHRWWLELRTRRPPTGVFGPEGPEVPLGVSERVSPKVGVCPKVSGEVPLGPF